MRRYAGSRSFNKQFQKLPQRLRDRFIERAGLFVIEPRHPLLNDHALAGKWEGHRSINVTGDYRAIYCECAGDLFQFVAIGTHHELFGM